MAVAKFEVDFSYRIKGQGKKQMSVIGEILLQAKPKWMPKFIYRFFTKRILELNWYETNKEKI